MIQPIDPTNLDLTLSPAEDFYHFANGGWLKKHPLPDEFSRYGTFDKLREENRVIVHNIIKKVAEDKEAKNSVLSGLVGDFYRTGMDIERINSLGYKPLLKDLDLIDSLQSAADISGFIAEFYSRSISALFHIYPAPDRENSEQIIASLHQGGMGLSDVDYYRDNSSRGQQVRKRYQAYMTRMFTLTGYTTATAEKAAADVLAMESRLAYAGMTRMEQRDPHNTFNKMSLADLENEYPSFNWKLFLNQLSVNTGDHLNVDQPRFFSEMSAMINDTPVTNWKHFFRWRLINSASSLLSDEIAETRFDFYERFLSGKKAMQPRWKRVTAATENALGEAIGRLFVEDYFPPEAKARMTGLVENLREALEERISGLDWMSADTKQQALKKLERMRVKIGYPEKWRSYEELAFSNESYYDNTQTAARFNQAYALSKIGKPADRDEWHMTPQTVNAYYHPLLNEIVFPAGILQPPFFFMDGDDAVNYGAIGVVIGHEMTHGFDDQGRKFDLHGNLNDWWSPEDAAQFAERSKVLEEQFNRIRINGDLFANGKLSLGENIADLGGVHIAYHALQKAWSTRKPEAETDGFTPQQRFFLAYAHIWANHIREEEKIRLTREDVHSLGINRVNGPLPNVEHFYDAFGISPGDNMFLPEDQRASIW